MFHRVKSEAQEPEKKLSQTTEKTYRKDEESPSSSRVSGSRGIVRDESSRKETETPAYRRGQPTHIKTEKESKLMRNQEKSPVQGKYTRESEEEQETTAESTESYKPSLSRGGYSGNNYNSTGYTPPEGPSYAAGGDRLLTIGRGINMSGEIDACDHLMVEGTVEAALKGAKFLEVAETGTFYGTVEIEEATIAGRFEGDITVNGRLTLKSTGVITGSIAYRELEVESGAVLDGRMTPMKQEVDQKAVSKYRTGSDASAMAKTKSSSKSGQVEPANSEAGLFSKNHASY